MPRYVQDMTSQFLYGSYKSFAFAIRLMRSPPLSRTRLNGFGEVVADDEVVVRYGRNPVVVVSVNTNLFTEPQRRFL